MFKKSLLAATAAGAMFLMAGAANATVVSYTTASTFIAAASGGGQPSDQVADNINWGVFASGLHTPQDGGTIPTGAQMTTSAGETITASDKTGAFNTYVQGQSWTGQFKTGTTVLFSNTALATKPVTLVFTSALSGLGLDLQTADPGPYSFTITAFTGGTNGVGGTAIGTATNSGTSTGTHSTTGSSTSNPDTVVFAGLISTAYNISYVHITNDNSALGGSGFAIDTSLLYHANINGTSNPDPSQNTGSSETPEPGTLGLLGAGLAGLGWVRRKRAKQA